MSDRGRGWGRGGRGKAREREWETERQRVRERLFECKIKRRRQKSFGLAFLSDVEFQPKVKFATSIDRKLVFIMRLEESMTY